MQVKYTGMLPKRLLAFLALIIPLFAVSCNGGSPVSPPDPGDEGAWILDFERTIDDFPFSESACREASQTGSAANAADTVPEDAVAAVRIISTACYLARVHVENPAGDTVRFFASRFEILHRTDQEKNRGAVGFVAWDGKDDEGNKVPDGRYLWRMEFDFGSGRLRKFRADIPMP